MQINPKIVIEKGWLKPGPNTKVQQNGIDFCLKDSLVLHNKSSQQVVCEEYVEIPEHIYACLYVRSTLNRDGVFLMSGLYDSGFKNFIGCRLYNLSGEVKVYSVGFRIGQIVFFRGESNSLYEGQYNDKK